MFVIRHKNYFYAFSLFLVVISLFSFWRIGFRQSVEFAGGALLEIQYEANVPSPQDIRGKFIGEQFKSVDALRGLTVQQTSDDRFLLRFGEVDEKTHQEILVALPGAKELQFQSVGPIIGRELRQRTILALILAVIAMFAYVAFVFRKVPKQIRSWRLGVTAIIALFHDIIIAAGGFVLFSHFYGFEIGTLFVAAELTIWGYSINDTIVVFDRIRENLLRNSKQSLIEIAAASLEQTMGRSLTMSITVLCFTALLFVQGPEPLLPFVAPLLVGVVIGTYSSICLATPLLLENFGKKDQNH